MAKASGKSSRAAGRASAPVRLGADESPTRPVDQGAIRDLNRATVLDALRHVGAASRADLARITALTKPTVSAIVSELVASGVVVDVGRGVVGTGGGRPPALIAFNDRAQFFAGVEILERDIVVALVDARGHELTRSTSQTSRDVQVTVTTIDAAVRDCFREVGATIASLGGVGIVAPGLIDESTGTCLLAPNTGWRDAPIGPMVAARLPGPVYVRNHAQAAALAEAVDGAGRGATVMVMLAAGVGVGAGVTVGGQLYAGATGVASEIGHCRVPDAVDRCTCGHRGCLETVASVRAILTAAGATTRASRMAKDLVGLVERSRAGDKRARGALERAALELGVAGSFLVNLFGPDVVVVTGPVFDVDEVVAGFRDSLAENALRPMVSRLTVRRSELGAEAPVRGALLTAMGGTGLRRSTAWSS